MKTNYRLDKGQIEVLDESMAEVLRKKTPAERIEIGFGLWVSACRMLMVHLKRSNPEWSAKKVKQEVARRMSHEM